MNMVEDDPERLKALQDNTLTELKKLTDEAKKTAPGPFNDRWIYRIVVIVLSAIVIIVAIGGVVMASNHTGPVPEAVVALGSAAIGALVGILAPSPGR
jgi:hypothetical protein